MHPPRTLPDLLSALVAIPSVAPGADSAGTPTGEAAMAEYLAGYLKALGGKVALRAVKKGRPNLIADFPAASAEAPIVAIVPHMDTVGVAGMTVSPFSPARRSGRLFGRGACDTKGPMAAALWGLKNALRRSKGRLPFRVRFVCTMGEEHLSIGAFALCEGGFKADFAVALEPTDLKVVHGCKGVLRVWVSAKGRAAHAARPELGINAAYRMAPFLAECRDVLAPAFARKTHPLLGKASLNVGVVQAGSELNVVPDLCRVGIDMRTHPNFSNQEALRAVRRQAKGLSVDVHGDGPSFSLDAEHPWVRSLTAHAKGATVVPWFSDANVFNAYGIPAVAFGPGSIAQAHTADEFISLSELSGGAKRFEAFFLSNGPQS